MPEPSFRLVCAPAALGGAPGSWARDMLREGEIALLPEGDDLAGISDVAHTLGLVCVAVVRTEGSAAAQEETVIAYAQSLPLVWIAPGFSNTVVTWARERGPMTLLVAAAGPLPEQERRRIDRFVATLGRQTE